MDEQLYTPAIAAKVSMVTEDMQRSLRSRFGDDWEHPIGFERNGRWLFSESDLIALASYSMHLSNQTSASQASHYAALLRKGLTADPGTDAVTMIAKRTMPAPRACSIAVCSARRSARMSSAFGWPLRPRR